MNRKKLIILLIILVVIVASLYVLFYVNSSKKQNEGNSKDNMQHIGTLDKKKVKDYSSSASIEKNYKSTKEYTYMKRQGLENIEAIVKTIDNDDKVNAFQEFISSDLTKATGKTFYTSGEFVKLLEDTRKVLPDKIYDLLNSKEDVDNKIFTINKYGVIAQPIVKQYIEDVASESDKITYKFNKDELEKLKEFCDKYEVNEKEEKALYEYITKD